MDLNRINKQVPTTLPCGDYRDIDCEVKYVWERCATIILCSSQTFAWLLVCVCLHMLFVIDFVFCYRPFMCSPSI